MKRNKVPNFYIAIFLIVVITVSTFSIVKIEENLYNKKYLAAETFISEGNNDKVSIVPKPTSIEINKGKFVLNKDCSIYIKGITDEETDQIRWIAEFLKEKLSASTGFDFNILKGDKPKEGSILLTTINANPKQGIEGYTLLTTPKIIKITAYKPEGISRAWLHA